jgi:hypothetical protein
MASRQASFAKIVGSACSRTRSMQRAAKRRERPFMLQAFELPLGERQEQLAA